MRVDLLVPAVAGGLQGQDLAVVDGLQVVGEDPDGGAFGEPCRVRADRLQFESAVVLQPAHHGADGVGVHDDRPPGIGVGRSAQVRHDRAAPRHDERHAQPIQSLADVLLHMVGPPRRAGNVQEFQQHTAQEPEVDLQGAHSRNGSVRRGGRRGLPCGRPHQRFGSAARPGRPRRRAVADASARDGETVVGNSRSTNRSTVGCGSWLAKPGRSLASMMTYSGWSGAAVKQVDPGDRDRQRSARRDARLRQHRVQFRGDVVDRPAGVQVGGPAHRELLALGQDIVHRPAGPRHGLAGARVQRDPRLAAGGRGATSRLPPDQLRDRVGAVPEDAGRPSDGGRDHLVADDDHAHVLAGHHLLDEDVGAVLPGLHHRAPQRLGVPDSDRDPLALLTASGFDDDLPHLVEELEVRGIVARRDPARDSQPRVGQDPPGDPLVVAPGHRQRIGQLRQRLAGVHDAGAVVSFSSPHCASVTSTRMPRRIASSATILAYGLSSS